MTTAETSIPVIVPIDKNNTTYATIADDVAKIHILVRLGGTLNIYTTPTVVNPVADIPAVPATYDGEGVELTPYVPLVEGTEGSVTFPAIDLTGFEGRGTVEVFLADNTDLDLATSLVSLGSGAFKRVVSESSLALSTVK